MSRSMANPARRTVDRVRQPGEMPGAPLLISSCELDNGALHRREKKAERSISVMPHQSLVNFTTNKHLFQIPGFTGYH